MNRKQKLIRWESETKNCILQAFYSISKRAHCWMFAWNIVLIQATAELTCWWKGIWLHKWYYGYLRVSVASFRWTTTRYASMIRHDVGQKVGWLIRQDIAIFVPNICIKVNVFYTRRVFMDTCCQTFYGHVPSDLFIICNIFFLPSDIFARNGGNKYIFYNTGILFLSHNTSFYLKNPQ